MTRKLFLTILSCIVFLTAAFYALDFVFAAFSGPPSGCVAPNCSGAHGTSQFNNFVIGSSTAATTTRLLIIGSSTNNSYLSLKIFDLNQGPILLIRNDGLIAIATSSFSTSTVLINGRLEFTSSSAIGGGILFPDNTLQTGAATAGSSTSATLITAGTFGTATTTGGNYTFRDKLAVSSTLTVSAATTSLPLIGVAYFGGRIGVGTSSPAGDIDIYNTTPQINLIESASGQTWGLRSGGVGSTIFDVRDVSDGKSWLTIKTNGNVGIGTSTPIAPLHIVGPQGGNAFITFEGPPLAKSNASSGPKSAGTVVDGGNCKNYTFPVTWSNPSNATTSDNNYASATDVDANHANDCLKATNFGFNIPTSSDVTIQGIAVDVERNASVINDVSDQGAWVLKNGVQGTDEKKSGNWPTTDAYVTYGGPTDLWGQTWTPNDINASTLGFEITGSGSTSWPVTANIDHIRMTVYYSTSTVDASGYWAFGADQTTASGTFKFANATSLGTSNDFVNVNTTGSIEFLKSSGGIKFPNGSLQQTPGTFAKVVKTDQPKNNDTSFSTIHDFDTLVNAGEIWHFEYFIFGSSTAAADFATLMSTSGGTAGTFTCALLSGDGGGGTSFGTGGTCGVNVTVTGNGPELLIENAWYTAHATLSSTITIAYSQRVAAAVTTTVYAGTFMVGQRIK